MNDTTPVRVHVVRTEFPGRPLSIFDQSTLDVWTPIIGPTATVLARRLVIAGDGAYTLDELGSMIGVRYRSKVWDAFGRLDRYALAAIGPVGDDDTADVWLYVTWPHPKRKGGAT